MHSRPEASEESLDWQLIPESNPEMHKRDAAWVEWWNRHRMKLLRFILGHYVPEAEAQVILQDTFSILFICVEEGTYDPFRGKTIIAYAYGIARNCVYVHQRGDAKHTDLEVCDWTAPVNRPVETKCQVSLNSQRLDKEIEKLSPKRRLMAQALKANLSLKTIAEEMGISPEAARKLAFDTRKDLRSRLSDLIEDDIWD